MDFPLAIQPMSSSRCFGPPVCMVEVASTLGINLQTPSDLNPNNSVWAQGAELKIYQSGLLEMFGNCLDVCTSLISPCFGQSRCTARSRSWSWPFCVVLSSCRRQLIVGFVTKNYSRGTLRGRSYGTCEAVNTLSCLVLEAKIASCQATST